MLKVLVESIFDTFNNIAEYGVAKSSISKWCTELRRECFTSPEEKEECDSMKELLKLKRENEELRKENRFLKKRRHSLQRKSIRGLSIYGTISYRAWNPLTARLALLSI